jgi:hypothetical protein
MTARKAIDVPNALVPIPIPGVHARGAWAPDLVVPFTELSRYFGLSRFSIKRLRARHPDIRISLMGDDKLSLTFESPTSQYGEVRIVLSTAGGPQEHVCLTHFGVCLHAIHMHSKPAKTYCPRISRVCAQDGDRPNQARAQPA